MNHICKKGREKGKSLINKKLYNYTVTFNSTVVFLNFPR